MEWEVPLGGFIAKKGHREQDRHMIDRIWRGQEGAGTW
jgi:hypothetical protein